jgi:hypothetical protein
MPEGWMPGSDATDPAGAAELAAAAAVSAGSGATGSGGGSGRAMASRRLSSSALAARKAGRSVPGMTRMPSSCSVVTSKNLPSFLAERWRCGPVERPVLPTYPMSWKVPTLSPFLIPGANLERCA